MIYLPAEDKIALLIGNHEYGSSLKPLPGVEADIMRMGKLLEKLNFKVISLINLNKNEMMNAVDDFCELLDKGVYGKCL